MKQAWDGPQAWYKGGVTPYNYAWTGSKPGAGHTPTQVGDTVFKNLFAYKGYRLKVTDSNGCVIDTSFEIGETPEIIIDSLETTASTCYSYDNAEIYIHAVGGNPALGKGSYTFSIDSGRFYYPATYGSDPNYAQMDTSVVKHLIPPSYIT